MVQFNLLPDIKMQYIKAKRQKRLINVLAFGIAAASLAGLVMFFSYVQIAQRKHLSDLNKDIKKYSDTLNNTPDLDKVLTIQNQLKSLPALLGERPTVSRLFPYIAQTTPVNVTISKMTADFAGETVSVSGTADKLESVNKYVDTFKFTTYKIEGSDEQKNAFSKVVLATFNRDTKGATYQITLAYDPAIFNANNVVKLSVPKTTTTRSTTEQPTQLFKTETTPTGGQ